MKAFYLFLFAIIYTNLYSQKELNYLRLIHYGNESPAALHLQGKLSANASGGTTISSFSLHSTLDISACYYIKVLKFALQYKSQTEDFDNFQIKTKALGLNKYFKIKKREILSVGLSIKFLTFSSDWDKINWADQVDSSSGFTKPGNETRFDNDRQALSFDIAVLYYNTSKDYFAGLLINDLFQPGNGFYPAAGLPPYLPREIKLYTGYNYKVSKHINAITTIFFRKFDYHNNIILRQDLLYKEKYWVSAESNFTASYKLSIGYEPFKHWRAALSAEIQPNPRIISGSTNFYKLKLGYVL